MKLLMLVCSVLVCGILVAQNKTDLGRESKVDSVIATVNGEPITLLDVILESGQDEARLAAMFTGERLYAETAKIRKAMVDNLVIRKLIYEKYKAKPFEIQKQHIEDMVDTLALSMGDGTRAGLERKARSYGSNMDEIREKARERIAVDVLLMQNCDRRVFITPREVYEAYQKHPEKWTKPATIDLQLILIRRGTGNPEVPAANIASMLRNADERIFSRIAVENSEGPNASKGGHVGKIEMNKLRPEFLTVLKTAAENEIKGPVETPEGFYFIRVNGISKEEKLPFDKVSKEIHDSLRRAALEKKRNEYKTQLLSEAVVRYFF